MYKLLSLYHAAMLDRRGISAVEYGILIGVVGVGLITALTSFSTDLQTWFAGMTGQLTAAGAPK